MIDDMVILHHLLQKWREGSLSATLLGVGPMSEAVIRATIELAREKRFPVFFIASRNQVDLHEFGGGYVKGWDQHDFVASIHRISDELSFDGPTFICRDHGGPWQRDDERKLKLPLEEAMERAKSSFMADLKAGFNLFHVDATKDPHREGPVPYEVVIERTLELVTAIESARVRDGLPPVAYEIGTEETTGGLTDEHAFDEFLRKYIAESGRRSLPRPSFIVGQTGTLIKMRRNVGEFSPETASRLIAVAKKFGVGFKEHNADYLEDRLLEMHPKLGIAAANVAPSFGAAETCAYLDLAAVEEGIKGTPSTFRVSLEQAALVSERWKKWLSDEEGDWTRERIASDPEKLSEITKVAGHYVFDDPKVKKEREEMCAFLEKERGMRTQRRVIEVIKASVDRYVRSFSLEGVTSLG